ncbi:MAG: tetratricopeptide repeat protein [Deltaproteobacteria bacterium]|nr:tetratricopeptide repeat protein [Deltaproteobacteria bacterium]
MTTYKSAHILLLPVVVIIVVLFSFRLFAQEASDGNDAAIAYRLYTAGKLIEAKEIYTGLVKSKKAGIDVFNNLCAIHYELKEYSEAESMCLKAVVADKSIFNAYFNLGLIARDRNKTKEAVGYFEKVLRLNNGHFFSLFHLGNIHQGRGDCAQAVMKYQEALDKADEQQGHLADLYYNMGIAQVACKKHGEGIKNYHRALKHAGKNVADIYYNLANALREQGKPKEAVLYYQKTIATDKGYISAYNNLGVTYSDMGQDDKAREIYEKALHIKDNLEVLYNLGLCYHHKGDNHTAYAYFKRALDLSPDDTRVLSSLAHVRGYLEDASYEKTLLSTDNICSEQSPLHLGHNENP